MLTKCVIALALVSQICAFKFNQDSISYIKPEQSNVKYSYQSPGGESKVQRIVTAATIKTSQSQTPNLGIVRPVINTAPITRTLVARGKYPITLQSSGPAPDKKIPILTSHVRAPVQEKPTIRLQAKIPAPKTIAHTCTCFKTIVKPRVQQHLITVPTIQKYIETLHRPVIENIHYEAFPVKCLDSSDAENSEDKDKTQTFQVPAFDVSKIQVQSNKDSEMQTFEFPSGQGLDLSKTLSEKSQVIEIPRVQFVQTKKPETVQMELPHVQFVQNKKPETVEIEIPRVQFVQNKKPETVQMELPHVQFVQNKKPETVEIELPRVQFLESQKSEPFEIPQAQLFENKKPQFVEVVNAQFVENNKAENAQLPPLEFLQAEKVQTVEIPRIQMEESPKVQTVEIPQQGGGITLGGAPFTYQCKH